MIGSRERFVIKSSLVSGLLGLLCPSAVCNAQSVAVIRIEVVEGGSGVSIRGAIVTVFDSGGARVAQALSDVSGTALLRVAAPSPLSIQAERVGYESVRLELRTVGAADHRVRVEMPPRRVNLRAVAVREKQECENQSTDRVRTAEVWLEARKALTATVLSRQRPEVGQLRALRYVRILSTGLRIEAESTVTQSRNTGVPFRSRRAEELSTLGYIHDLAGVTFYEAPDADVLLSETFVADHCFGLTRRQSADSSLLGLSFTPKARRSLPDIRGVLWLDESTAELRYVDYAYTGVPVEAQSAHIGGRLEFAPLADGRWIVQRWRIRNPRMGIVPRQQVGSLIVPRRVELIGYREEGGLVSADNPVVSSVPSRRESAPMRPAVVEGLAFDSTIGKPLVNARVSLVGTQVVGSTDSLGRFRLNAPLDGDYTLAVTHDRISLVGLATLSAPVSLRPEAVQRVTLGTPSPRAARQMWCPADSSGSEPGVRHTMLLVGMVTDSVTQRGVPNADVIVRWSRAVVDDRGSMVNAGMVTQVLEVETDSRGAFKVCGIPHYTTVTIQAVAGTSRGELQRFFTQEVPLHEVAVVLAFRR